MKLLDSGMPVDELIRMVQVAIKQANVSNSDTGRDLRIVSMYLKLSTVVVTSAGGRLDFRVPVIGMKLKVGGSVTREDTHTIEITLVPDDLHSQHEIRDGPVEVILVEAIETLRTVMARGSQGDDPFLLQDSTVELSFAVTQDGSISLGIDGGLKNEITHTLRLGLAIPSPSQTDIDH